MSSQTLLRVVLLLITCGLLQAIPTSKLDSIPLVADDTLKSLSHNVGCEFGNAKYDIDSVWHPTLEPYGVMYCLKCSCNAVIKKGLLQQRGQVQCRRISQECPDVSSCQQTPILPPNSCCKICPENEDGNVSSTVAPVGKLAIHDSMTSTSHRLDHQSAFATNAKSSSSYLTGSGIVTELSALLTPATNVTSGIVGKAFMMLEQSVLRVTIHLSQQEELSGLQIVDKNEDNIYETTDFSVSHTEGTSKICLVWRDAFKHTDELKSGLAQIILTSTDYPQGLLSGHIRTVSTQVLETFSTLFTDTLNQGYAGTLSMGVVTASKSLVIRGTAIGPSTVHGKHTVTLEILRDRRILFSDEQIVAFSEQVCIALVLYYLLRSLMFPSGIALSGAITTFSQCGELKALITGQDALPKYETMGVAVAALNLTSSGSVHYKIEIKDIESRINEIAMETERTSLADSSRKVTRLAKDINDRMHIVIEGVYDKTDAVEIQLLLEGKLFINVATRLKPSSALRGQILLVPVIEADEILMNEQRTGMASIAWCETTNCELTCAVLVPRSSVQRDSTTKAYLDYWDQKKLLLTFTETNLMEITVTQTEVQQIASTLPTIRVVTDDSTLYGQASIPESCFDGSPKLVLPSADENSGPRVGWVDTPLVIAHKCSYDKKVYSDGESWKPEDSSLACVTCSCKRNKAQCHPVVCPAVDCDNPVTLPGECCPACPKPTDNTTKSCFFPGDHRNHAVGTVWHPFMHPGGYFKCAVCYCKEGGEGYDCKQTSCPELTCGKHLQETLPGECCPSCKNQSQVATAVGQPADLTRMQGDSDNYSSCKVGDRQYANGESFNPQIGTLGMYGTVLCKCKNGELECNKIECNCNKKISRKNRCCMKQCGFTEAEISTKPSLKT